MSARTFPFRARGGRAGVVRQARARDARACLAIVEEAVRARPRTLAVLEEELWATGEWRRHRIAWSRRGVWLVAELDGVVVGQLTCERGTRPAMAHAAEFGITVSTAARGRGVGRALLKTLEVWAAEVGVDRLGLGVFADNERAIALYRSLGYAEEGRERRLMRFPESDVDVIVMAKFLDEATGPAATMVERDPREGRTEGG